MILNSLKSNLGYATVTLDYDEIVKIHNALYECKDEKTKSLCSQFGVLHSLTKEGALEELKTIWEIEAEQKEQTKGENKDNWFAEMEEAEKQKEYEEWVESLEKGEDNE